MYEAWVYLSGYINGKKIRIWSSANLRALHENPLHSQRLVFCVQCLNSELRNPCSLKRQLLQIIFQIFMLNLLLCSKGSLVLAICGKVLWKEQQLSCWILSLTALSDADVGHHNPQPLHHLTSFCGDYLNKESTAITQEAWRTLNTITSKFLPELTNKHFQNLQKPLWKGWMLILKKVRLG